MLRNFVEDIVELLRRPPSNEFVEQRDRMRANEVAALYSRGNVSLSKGRILEPEDIQAEWSQLKDKR
jgi:hypothetical protein